MFSILDLPPHRRGLALSRREWLRVGGIGFGGLSLPSLLAAATKTGTTRASETGLGFGKAKSVIVVFLGGGPPQHETWDTKPEAPAEIRGPFGSIATRTPGYSVGELMPQTALLTDKIAVLRAMVTNDNAHSSSGYHMMTGVPHIPPHAENATSKAPNLAPPWGSIAKYVKPVTKHAFPPAVTLPTRIANVGDIPWPGQIGGVLGPKYDPWVLTCDPSKANFSVPGLALPTDMSTVQFQNRLSLLDQMNRQIDGVLRSPAIDNFDRQTQQAVDLVSGAQARKAFDLSQETPETRERYGASRWAQSLLLSRRLVEAGVSLVHVNWCQIDGEPNAGSWDTHEKHNDMLKRLLMPMMDKAFSALMNDLTDRGMLDETLVVWVGEFGHTPKFNGNAGRDHWGSCFSVALAGGGVRGGVVHGKSDAHAAFPVSGRVEPRDLISTIFHCLGHSPDTELHETEGRPIPLSRGRVIEEIL
ncbi:MAG: hypothetical protein JWN70_4103 [Planctomycetaceae bacterium]|nr:hypothetical protein [Planctomycetaceae bacterium]